MATVPQIKAAIENFWANHGAKFINRQDDYFGCVAGRSYWQGIRTPDAIPDSGAVLPADYTKHPTDQTETWANRFAGVYILPTNIPCQISVDVYDGPFGKGWTCTLIVSKAGRTYSRTWNVGPEDRARPWADVTPQGIP